MFVNAQIVLEGLRGIMVSADVGIRWMIGSCIRVDMPGGHEFLTGVRRLVPVGYSLIFWGLNLSPLEANR